MACSRVHWRDRNHKAKWNIAVCLLDLLSAVLQLPAQIPANSSVQDTLFLGN